MRRLLLAALVAVALVLTAAPFASADPPQLRRDGRWLVDPQGRVVLRSVRQVLVAAERGAEVVTVRIVRS
ncbi:MULTISPECIES: hypothetical protein [unclassified Nocardioides]|uniref:hypothetical protein n=1 Tax=unclassified Nocardioides TaxID=2615069 RepID=UPI0003129015|nr:MULTISPECIES: hypothetical protein [unclassified Nocardioides]